MEAYKHCKTIAASGMGVELLNQAGIRTGESTTDGQANGESRRADNEVV